MLHPVHEAVSCARLAISSDCRAFRSASNEFERPHINYVRTKANRTSEIIHFEKQLKREFDRTHICLRNDLERSERIPEVNTRRRATDRHRLARNVLNEKPHVCVTSSSLRVPTKRCREICEPNTKVLRNGGVIGRFCCKQKNC